MEFAGIEHGKTLDSSVIEAGLRSLNTGFHFDLAGAIGQQHPYINDRQGVYFEGKHICSMDRGPVPEFKLWTVKKELVEVPWADADKPEVSIQFAVLPPEYPGYDDLYDKAVRRSDHSLGIRADGKLVRQICVGYASVRGHCIRLGWRHTFEGILRHDIARVTRQSIGAKFGVDMMRFPVGDPDELVAALVEE